MKNLIEVQELSLEEMKAVQGKGIDDDTINEYAQHRYKKFIIE